MARPVWSGKAHARALAKGYRSGLEDKIATQVKQQGHEVRFETFKIPYVLPQSDHKYTPDFMLDNGIIIEGKGLFDASDRAKHLLLKAQYPELDIRFVFTRSAAPITKGSKTTYAMWCQKHGIKYADKLIPEAWFKEAGPEVKPTVVIKRGPYGFSR